MAIAKELLLDPLPAAAKRRVVWRERFWLTDEALSVYVRSAGLFGSEMHSPIMAVGNGVPAIVCRFAEQTSKGFMWRDIGLGQWLFDLDDEADHDRIAPAVLEMLTHVERSRAAVATARSLVADRHGRVMKALSETLNATAPSS
jgi:polysaccharide pyruvyl transferase WcaK-like protein